MGVQLDLADLGPKGVLAPALAVGALFLVCVHREAGRRVSHRSKPVPIIEA